MTTTITVSGTNATQYTVDTSDLSPLANVVVADTAGQSETVSLTLSSPSHGALSNLGGGTYNAATGVYSVAGTAAQVTAALQGLIFSPTLADQALKTTFVIRVADSAGNTAINSHTTVTSGQPITIATNGVTTLASLGNPNGQNDTYILENTSGNQLAFLTYNGNPVTVGQFGAWAPVGAKQTGTGYEVVWSNGANEYVVWNVNSAGAYTGGAAPVESSDVAALEANFGELGRSGEFLGSNTPPASPTTIVANGTTVLASIGNMFELNPAAGGAGPFLEYQGLYVTAGQFGAGWAPVAAVQTGTGYEVAWGNAGLNEYTVWNVGSNGNYTNSATGVLSTTNPMQAQELQALEANFAENFAGLTPAVPAVQAQNSSTILAAIGNLFELNPAVGGTGPLLELNGSAFVAGQYSPVGAIWTGHGYEVAFSAAGGTQFVVWNTDSGGNYTSAATPVLAAGSAGIEAVEANFAELFTNAGPAATAIALPGNPTTTVDTVGNLYEMVPTAGGLGPLLELNGKAVTAGQFSAGWAPIGALKTATGYDVAFKVTGQSEYIIWNTDSNGNYTSAASGILSGTSYALEEWETTFDQDLNGDATIGPTTTPIGTNGALAAVANQYQLTPSAGPFLQLNGSVVTASQFAAGWTPVGAVATASGWEVAFGIVGSNQYEVWNVNSSGAYIGVATGILAGASAELEGVEAAFGETFVGAAGPAAPIALGTNNQLDQVGNVFELIPQAGGNGPLLELNGGVVTATQFPAGWTPIGAKQTGNGYEVVLSISGADEYQVWNTNSSGQYTGAATGILSGASPTLEAVEADFGEAFAGAGPAATAATIASNSTTTLAAVGNVFELNPTSGGTGPLLELNGAVVTANQFPAGWTPVAAIATGAGYEVAFSAPGAGGNEYVVWNLGSNGNYTSAATGILTATSSASTLEGLEANFGENFAGLAAAAPVSLADNGTTTLAQVGNLYELLPDSGGAGTLLEYQGSVVTVGGFGDVTPVGAVQTASGFEVAWSLVGQDEYTVWNTDKGGNYTSSPLGVVTGQNFSLEDLNPTFLENVNGAPVGLSTVLVTSANPSGAVNLSTQTQNTTVNLGTNTASAVGGLAGATSTISGTPFAITLGADADIIEYGLSPSSGIETIANFNMSIDELNIGMRGAPNSALEFANTMLGSTAAISIYSAADPAHGLLLLNPTDNIATLQAHTTFQGNHALITAAT